MEERLALYEDKLEIYEKIIQVKYKVTVFLECA